MVVRRTRPSGRAARIYRPEQLQRHQRRGRAGQEAGAHRRHGDAILAHPGPSVETHGMAAAHRHRPERYQQQDRGRHPRHAADQHQLFSLNGQAAPATSPAKPYTGPSFGDLTDVAGNVIIACGIETTTPIAATPDDTLSTSTAVTGGTTVHGNYQVRGAYFFVKLGPSSAPSSPTDSG